MNKVQILDCTLRDGGYCNNWTFGARNICSIVEALSEANVEIIECGFITNRVYYDENVTKYSDINQIKAFIPKDREGKIFVAMMNYGEFSVEDLPDYDGSSIDGIRVAFHKSNRVDALDVCKKIKNKGYLVFIQAMVSLSYTDREFLDMIQEVNEFEPYAFYIVDSFGMMKGKDLTRLFFLVEHNLKENIWIGFHSHNNMQLAYSNAQKLTSIQTTRNLIIDSSIYGMGRGAGNLNTELFVDYLNENAGKQYNLKPLLIIIDRILNDFYQRNYWGYSLPNYISASHNAHPNYAGYLDDKKTLTIDDMNEIFSMMSEEKKVSYDKEYIEELYLKYQEKDKVQDAHIADFEKRIIGKKLLIVAPGKSALDEREKIVNFAMQENVITISINYDYDADLTDYIFTSNLRRFRELPRSKYSKTIVTSNISSVEVYLQTMYKDLLNDTEAVRDNAGLMLVNLLIKHGAKEIYIAGMDGYSHDPEQNYVRSSMSNITSRAVIDAMNKGMSQVLCEYSKIANIHFVTTPRHVTVDGWD